MKALRQAASRLGEMVASGIEHAQQATQGTIKASDVESLDESRARITALRQSMDGLKQALVQHSKQVVLFSQSTSSVSVDWSGLYAHSASRSNSLHTFTTAQSRIESAGVRLYKDEFGWEVLSILDEWDRSAAKISGDVEKTEKARGQVQQLEEKVRALRAAKEKRTKKGEALTPKEEQQLEGSEAMLDKYQVALSNMRLNFDKNLAHFFESRFSHLDKAFVRFMEMQMDYFREGMEACSSFHSIVDNYRKRFPRSKTSQGSDPSSPPAYLNGDSTSELSFAGAAAASSATVASFSSTTAGSSSSSSSSTSADVPARSRSTPPQPISHDSIPRPSIIGTNAAAPVRSATIGAAAGGLNNSNAVKRAPSLQEESDSDSDTDSGSGSDDATDSSDEETPSAARHSHHNKNSNASSSDAAPQMDLFHFPSSSSSQQPNGAPAKKSPSATNTSVKSPPSAGTADIVDFFGGAAPTALSSSSSAQPSSKLQAKKAATSSSNNSTSSSPPPPAVDFSFDFSGGDSYSSSSSSSSNNNNSSKSNLHQSVSTPALNNSFLSGFEGGSSSSSSSSSKKRDEASSKKRDDGLHSFDPFSGPPSSTNKSTAAAASSSSSSSSSGASRMRSSTPPPAAPGTSQSGLVNAYIPPTHELEDHIRSQQDAKVEAIREAEARVENELEARREAEINLEGQLTAWETNKDGVKKNIRNLLSSVHTVLWPNSGWKPVSFADLIDFNAIKKAHMKVIRVVHPDRLQDATPQQMVIALRVFDCLNTAFDQFKLEQGR